VKITFDEATHTYTLDGIRLPSVTEVTRFCAYDYKSDRPWLAEAAARRGTAVHEACALIDYGEEPEETPEIAGYLKAYRRFLKDYRPEWEGIEYTVGNQVLAGTIDRFGYLYDSRFCILDIKTGARLHDAPLRGQLTGYRLLLALQRHLPPDAFLYALQLSRDGTYVLREVRQDDELLKACLFLHQAAERKTT
jgi:hypothetical protein